MTAELPAPLVPPEVDLTDFRFMPLDVRRLRDSDLAALTEPEAFRAAVLLWGAAWHQVPAGSLPDDNRVLAVLAGYGRVVKEWLRFREGALHGFVKCSDGRLYHTVVCEKALEAWEQKLQRRYRLECDRLRKENKRRFEAKEPALPIPTFEQWRAQGAGGVIPPEPDLFSGGTSAASAGKRTESPLKGTERDLIREKHDPSSGQTAFARYWSVVPNKVKKKTAHEVWTRKKLDSKVEMIIADIQRRIAHDDRWKRGFVPDPPTYLRQERWDDEITKPASPPLQNGGYRINGKVYRLPAPGDDRGLSDLSRDLGIDIRGLDRFQARDKLRGAMERMERDHAA
jgi:hypothetical protein